MNLGTTNTVWISTAPRTGSMWIFNITRELLRSAGLQVEPADIPQSDEAMFEHATNFAFPSQDEKKCWVLKVHTVLRPDLPRSKIITTHRDPRDVLVSYKEFMNASFEKSLGCARAVTRYTDAYESYSPNYLLTVAYADIENRPVQLVLEIARFLDLQISEDTAAKMASKYSRSNVRKKIDKTDNALKNKISKNMEIDQREVVYLSADNYRAFDRKSGFQTGHVSQRKTGDWKRTLSDAEQQQLNEEFGSWLEQHGYER